MYIHIGNRTMKCKRRNEEMAFSAARRHFAAAKNILQVCAPRRCHPFVIWCPLVSLAHVGPCRLACFDARLAPQVLTLFSVRPFGLCVVWEGRKSMSS